MVNKMIISQFGAIQTNKFRTTLVERAKQMISRKGLTVYLDQLTPINFPMTLHWRRGFNDTVIIEYEDGGEGFFQAADTFANLGETMAVIDEWEVPQASDEPLLPTDTLLDLERDFWHQYELEMAETYDYFLMDTGRL